MSPSLLSLFDLTGQVAVVTGGTGHLGSAMSEALAEAGARVVLTSREAAKAQAAAEKLPSPAGARHVGLPLDHMQADTLESQFAAVLDAAGRVDVLVNNGHEALAADWTTVTAAEFSRHLQNATGYFVLSRLVREHAVVRGGGASIVLLGSMYGQVASYPEAYEGVCPASPVAYHALKGGLIHMTRHLAVYWAVDGVRVNCLSPGPFPPERIAPELVARLCARSPMRRMGQPWELKGAIVFLASRASSYMTGQNLTIDGGWTAW